MPAMSDRLSCLWNSFFFLLPRIRPRFTVIRSRAVALLRIRCRGGRPCCDSYEEGAVRGSTLKRMCPMVDDSVGSNADEIFGTHIDFMITCPRKRQSSAMASAISRLGPKLSMVSVMRAIATSLSELSSVIGNFLIENTYMTIPFTFIKY
jgi:hypothetical protein